MAYARILFYDVPASQVEAALDALDREGFGVELDIGPASGESHPNRPAVLELNASYHRSSNYADAAEIADAVANDAPGALFSAWSDPDEEQLGVLRIHVPGLGMYGAECGEAGDPVVPADAIREALADDTIGPRAALLALIGQGWTDAIAAAGKALDALPARRRWVVACPYEMADCDRPAGDSHQECRAAAEAMDEAYELHPVRAAEAAIAPPIAPPIAPTG